MIRAATVGVFVALSFLVCAASAQIPAPTDAPRPLPPEESAKRFRIPVGFQLELLAAEPLVREPTGVCWDARGRMFVSELHGYNLEGQYDIEELNKTGVLDRAVRRVEASDTAKAAAKTETYGTVKLLRDADGDGRLDRAEVFADRLPPCYGVCPARDGVIAVGGSDIVFLADRDGDHRAEVREVLYTGFPVGMLERGINCPQWGLDDWIYVGRGHGGGTISGPRLKQPVELPHTDFRIRADGTAIEPVLGGTASIGSTFTERGDRFVVTTVTPGIFVAPIPWRYLARNPDFAAGPMEERVGGDRTYPISQPHPWRTKRAADPGFADYFTRRYGKAESIPNGFFTSVCSPLVYQGDGLPGLDGQYLVCEPAQNLVHRAVIEREGPHLRLTRAQGEQASEFLASSDAWFHPIALTHMPDGGVCIVDFYREIIEDYSAVPRYLQQQYGLNHGHDRGRLWRLAHRDAPPAASADVSEHEPAQLAEALGSKNLWRRQTAQRLLVEGGRSDAAPAIRNWISPHSAPAAAIAALYALRATDALRPADVSTALTHADAGVRVNALRLAEPWLDREPRILTQALALAQDEDESVALQAALSLGESHDPRAFSALAELARRRGDVRYMDAAITSSLSGRGGAMFAELVATIDASSPAVGTLQSVAATIAARRDRPEISSAIVRLASVDEPALRRAALDGLRSPLKSPRPVALDEPAAVALRQLADDSDRKTSAAARTLMKMMRVETQAEREARIADALATIVDIQLRVERRMAAVADVAADNEPRVTQGLLAAVADSTPRVQEAILAAIFSRSDRLPDVVAALEAGTLPASALSALQRAALVEHRDAALAKRAADVLRSATAVDEKLFQRYAAALQSPRDPARGGKLFREKCGVCHQAHGVGVAVGPNLDAEAKRAEETLLQDLLAPSGSITAGYAAYTIVTTDGQVLSGLLAGEAAASVTLKQSEGKTQTVLRKEIEAMKASSVSLMPSDLEKTLSPQDVADVIAWLRGPGGRNSAAKN